MCNRFVAHPHYEELYPYLGMYPLEPAHINFLMVENTGNGKDVKVLVITDHFTRYAQAIIITLQTAQAMAMGFFTHYGFPTNILSNQGNDFESKLIKELCDLGDIHKICTTPYHPQENGQCKWFNSTLISMIGTLQNKDKSHWRDFIPTCLQLQEKQHHWIQTIILNVLAEAKFRPQSPVWITNGRTALQGTPWLCKLAGEQTALGLQFDPGMKGITLQMRIWLQKRCTWLEPGDHILL